MAVQALHSAATGMQALSTEIDVIANNLANVNTQGFKGSRVNFEDLIYEQKRQPGVENDNGERNPGLLQVGLGVQVANTQFDFSTGSPVNTGRPLDMFIQGDGFFKVTLPGDRSPDQTAYTRMGNFFVNPDGQLVLGNGEGNLLDPGVTIPDDATGINVSPSGVISALNADQTITELGTLELATFVNKSGLRSIGGNLFVETDLSGPPINGQPQDGQLGGILQSHVESSNVDPVTELVSLIKAQRAFELNSQTIQAADETLQVVGNLRRF